jgi:hypothetical protein
MSAFTKVPFIAFFAWCISGPRALARFFVEGGAANGGVYDRASAHEYAALRHVAIDLFEDDLG